MKRKSKEHKHYECSRRDFIKNTMTGLGTIAMGSLTASLIEGCSSTDPKMYGSFGLVKFQRNGASISVNISMSENQALAKVGGTLALRGNDIDRKGLLLYRESETTIKAYSRECTHNKCSVGPFINGVSTCPCHRSQYNLSGERVAGPAPKPLAQYATAVDGNIITIRAK